MRTTWAFMEYGSLSQLSSVATCAAFKKAMSRNSPPVAETIAERIHLIRGEKVLLDSHLAQLYGVATKRLNEQVRRNPHRFPPDFMFRLTDQEVTNLRSQNATSKEKSRRGGRRYLPWAFTEHGTLARHKDLAKKLAELESKTAALALSHDALAADTRTKFREVIEALRQLMAQEAPKRRPIGFIVQN